MANDKDEKAAKAEREQMEVGGTGNATVAFTGAGGDDIEIKSSTWTAHGPVAVTPNPDDPTEAALFAAAPGPVTLTCVGQTETGATATASLEIMVVDNSLPTEGTISLSVQAPAHQSKPKPAAPAQQPKGENHGQVHHATATHRA